MQTLIRTCKQTVMEIIWEFWKVQCTGISLHTKLKSLHSLAHLHKNLVLKAWTFYRVYKNVYKHFLPIYWVQLIMLQMFRRHDHKDAQNGHFTHPWEISHFWPPEFIYITFFWQGIERAIKLLKPHNFEEFILRTCCTEHEIVTAWGSRNVAVFHAALHTK
jgi:hypothetical protein